MLRELLKGPGSCSTANCSETASRRCQECGEPRGPRIREKHDFERRRPYAHSSLPGATLLFRW